MSVTTGLRCLRRANLALFKVGLCVGLLLLVQMAFAGKIMSLSVQGGIGPASADFIVRGIDKGQHADLILIQLDTPGGLDKSLRQIVQAILNSHTPVVTYVAPNGARAASAGTYVLYASTIAAMAPGTHLGAASPVRMTSAFSESGESDKLPSTMDKKAMNDAVAYIRSLAQLRHRNVEFAQKAVLDAATMTAPEALKQKVIDYIAPNTNALLIELNGKIVRQQGRDIKLNTHPAEIETIQPDWRMQFLQVITDPTIAYLLLLLGLYGIFFELVNPGVIAPGVIGAVAMLVALYGLQLLPISYAGLSLILLGILFMIAESFVPSFGSLGLGGTLAFIIGSVLLIDTHQQAYQIAWSAILAMAAANILVLVVLAGMAIKARQKPILHGTTALIGAHGRTIGEVNLAGQAVIHGEIWNVHATHPIKADTAITVTSAHGLELHIKERTQGVSR